jgi:nickel/cobalt transporter (NiCoT) family protein
MSAFLDLFNDHPNRPRFKTLCLFLILGILNMAVWVWAWMAFSRTPALLGTALLAYLFGLRHAVDADHIAAIDNVVRKLSQKGGKPLSTGFFFSLGHSTVVVLASVAVAGLAAVLESRFRRAGEIGGILGTGVSAFFLLFIAFSNLFILKAVWKTFLKARQGEKVDEEDLNALLSGRGFFTRLLKSLFDLVTESRHMYLVGFLFGLGFDTATEVGLLGLSASQAVKGLSLGTVLIFPALFTSGMALIDTADSVLMVEVYGWAFLRPLRKLWYNLTLTALSIFVALFIGGLEALGLLADRLGLSGGFWNAVGNFNNDLNRFGYAVIGVFLLGWAASVLLYRLQGYEERPSASLKGGKDAA